jgi:hypothetical protein
MKPSIIIIPALFSLFTLQASAIELADLKKSSVDHAQEQLSPIKTNAMISFTAEQLNLSESTVSAGFGSLLKVAKDNLSSDNFALISKAVPDVDKYLDTAPKMSTDALSSLLSNSGSAGKKADSLQYLNAAFEKIGLPKEQVPALVNTLTGYIEKSGYGEAAGYLKQALNFL